MRKPHPHYDYYPGGQPVWPFKPIVRSEPSAWLHVDDRARAAVTAIAAGHNTSRTLFERLGISLQQCQREMLKLDRAGLIHRSRNDGRNDRVARLTPAGKKMLRALGL